MCDEGLRVIAVASLNLNRNSEIPDKITQYSLKFHGVVGLEDPARYNIEESIASCRRAGIRIVMITGDNGITALSIAKKVGITIPDNHHIITGDMLEIMSDVELREKISNVNYSLECYQNRKCVL